MTNIPAQPTGLIGRKTELAGATELVRAKRLVTFVGPAGIGKTRLAIEVACRLLPEFADDAWIVDLAPLASAEALVPTVAAALNFGSDIGPVPIGPTSLDSLAAALGPRNLLLILDGCENVAPAAALLADTLMRANPAVHVLATSREPLLLKDEHVLRVLPLALPPSAVLSSDDALRCPAVKLFLNRAMTANPGFVPDPRMAAICRRIDGIPLAIELAAARAALQGAGNVASQLDEHFRRLIDSRRTPLPHHKTLQATLDWSFGLLSNTDRSTLLHIAIFTGPFSANDACAVTGSSDPDIRASLHRLAANSFVTIETLGAATCFRLPGSVRAYSLEQLVKVGNYDHVARLAADFSAGKQHANAGPGTPGPNGPVRTKAVARFAPEVTPVLFLMATP